MRLKPSVRRGFRLAAVAAALAAASCGAPDDPGPPPPSPSPPIPPDVPSERPAPPPTAEAPPAPAEFGCAAPEFREAAAANAASLRTLSWAPFRRPEVGWEIYAPLMAHEIGVRCAPGSEGFAAALADWQANHGAPRTGRVTPQTFDRMKGEVQGRRPFVQVSARGVCPPPPPGSDLVAAKVEEGYAGKHVELRRGALEAYRRMADDARRTSPTIADDKRNLTIFSAYRSPEYDAERCQREKNCNGIVRATCSPHRTGLAVDLFVGAAPGYGPDSSADANRLFQTKTETYRWLLANAHRYGFVNYPFEPWHWEWVGEAP